MEWLIEDSEEGVLGLVGRAEVVESWRWGDGILSRVMENLHFHWILNVTDEEGLLYLSTILIVPGVHCELLPKGVGLRWSGGWE